MKKCVADLVMAALKTAAIAERQLAHEAEMTAILQRAAQDAREGRLADAQNKRFRVDAIKATTVFDYQGAFASLCEAAKRYRKQAGSRCPHCDGSGHGTTTTCRFCRGTGQLPTGK